MLFKNYAWYFWGQPLVDSPLKVVQEVINIWLIKKLIPLACGGDQQQPRHRKNC